MSAELVTPKCEITGLPLPVVSAEPREIGVFSVLNRHHGHHPSSSVLLSDTAGEALRASRIQKINSELHTRYHQIFYGPQLPHSYQETFNSTVLAVAGAVPKTAVEIDKDNNWRVREITTPERCSLTRPGVMLSEKPKKIAEFLSNYVLSEAGIESAFSLEIEEFVDNKTSQNRKKELASFILGETLDANLISLASAHQGLKREGYIAPVAGTRIKTLRHAAKFIIRKHNFGYYTDSLARTFA